MKIFISSLMCLMAFQTQAATRLQFFIGDRNAMIIITPTDYAGNTDSDTSDLYQLMNVPEQDSILGKGKSIVSINRDFNFICGREKNQCQAILTKSADVVISSEKKYTSFKLSGPEAAQITSLFKLNDRGEAYFLASDKLFRIYGDQNSFVFEAAQ